MWMGLLFPYDWRRKVFCGLLRGAEGFGAKKEAPQGSLRRQKRGKSKRTLLFVVISIDEVMRSVNAYLLYHVRVVVANRFVQFFAVVKSERHPVGCLGCFAYFFGEHPFCE